MWARRGIPANDARCLRSPELAVNGSSGRADRLGKLVQRPRALGLQQQQREQSKLISDRKSGSSDGAFVRINEKYIHTKRTRVKRRTGFEPATSSLGSNAQG